MADALHAFTLGDAAREHARSRPHKLAVVDGERRLTYAELDARVNRLANGLHQRGVAAGSRVLWLGQNSHRVLEGLLAAAKLDAVLCPANWRMSAEELAFVIDDVEPEVVIWQEEEVGERALDARRRAAADARWIQHDDGGEDSYERLLETSAVDDPDLVVDPANSVLMLYTAAFGGRPNGALLSHSALVHAGLVMALAADIGPDYVFLNSGPLFHVGTLMWTMPTFLLAGTNVFVRRVDAEEICGLIERERCTGAFIMGPTIDAIVDANADGRYDLKSLRANPGRPEWNRMVTLDDSPMARQRGGYGQTEVVGLATFGAFGPPPEGTSGRASPVVQVRIVDPDGGDVPPGEVGEIVVRGPTVMNGYHRRPELNDERLAGGWHRTTDLGQRHEDGSITFIGPRTRIIKSAAENIYPAEVEACLAAHPDVAEAAVIGVPDPTWTQSVKALVVPAPGARPDAEELIEWCRDKIASYKKPRSVELVESLPRRDGRVDYDALDEQFGGGGYPGRS